jgi:pilus assembly protein Flp/PilA
MLNHSSHRRLSSHHRRGQGLVEYALIIAGVSLVCVVGVTMFGHKTADLIDAVAVVLPGAHTDDNGPITAGQLVELTPATSGSVNLDLNAIQSDTGQARLGTNIVGGSAGSANGLDGLIVDPSQGSGT